MAPGQKFYSETTYSFIHPSSESVTLEGKQGEKFFFFEAMNALLFEESFNGMRSKLERKILNKDTWKTNINSTYRFYKLCV